MEKRHRIGDLKKYQFDENNDAFVCSQRVRAISYVLPLPFIFFLSLIAVLMMLGSREAWLYVCERNVHVGMDVSESKGLVAQLCLTLCNPMDCSPPGSSVHGILQTRILVWVAVSFSRGSSQPRAQTWVSWIVGRFFTVWAARGAPPVGIVVLNVVTEDSQLCRAFLCNYFGGGQEDGVWCCSLANLWFSRVPSHWEKFYLCVLLKSQDLG